MDLPVGRSVVWRAVGFLCYLVGLLLSLLVVVDLFVGGGAGPDGVSEQTPRLVASIVLIVAGRAVIWKFGGRGRGAPASLGQPPGADDESPLEELGYVTPEPDDEELDIPEPEPEAEQSVVCEECGTRNEQGYVYCHSCSAELPE